MKKCWSGWTKRNMAQICMTVAAASLLLAGPAAAHVEQVGGSGFVEGLTHPVTGFDHVVAMLAVGLWGGVLGKPALWLLPVIFPLVMAAGGALGVVGAPLPGVETGIALSGLTLGMMVLLSVRPPLWIAAVLVGTFAIFHGHAHGQELPESSDPTAFAAGFVISTGVLHIAGIGIGQAGRWQAGRWLVRGAGGLIAAAGGTFLFALT